jgi:hypothetical protein
MTARPFCINEDGRSQTAPTVRNEFIHSFTDRPYSLWFGL